MFPAVVKSINFLCGRCLLGLLLISGSAVAADESEVSLKYSDTFFETIVGNPQYAYANGEVDIICYGWPEGAEHAVQLARVPFEKGGAKFEVSIESPMLAYFTFMGRSIQDLDFSTFGMNDNFAILEPGALVIENAFAGMGSSYQGGRLAKLLLECGENEGCSQVKSGFQKVDYNNYWELSQHAKRYSKARKAHFEGLLKSASAREKGLMLQISMSDNRPYNRLSRGMQELFNEFGEARFSEGWFARKYALKKKREEDRAGRKSLSQAVSFKAETLAGESIEFIDLLAGKELVLLDFWASWCRPCRAEIPHLKKLYSQYQGKGFEIVSYTLDDDRDDWELASEEESIEWVNLGMGSKSEAVKKYFVSSIPTTWLIDPASKKVLARNLRSENLDKIVDDFLKARVK